MGKLTDSQKRIIVAAYYAGGVSLRDLAAEYRVSKDTITKILRENEDIRTKIDTIKKAREEQDYKDILDYFNQNASHLAGRISKALDVPDEALDASSPKERCGFAKVVAELVLMMKHERDGEDNNTDGDKLEIVFVDNSKKDAEEDET